MLDTRIVICIVSPINSKDIRLFQYILLHMNTQDFCPGRCMNGVMHFTQKTRLQFFHQHVCQDTIASYRNTKNN